jgi:polyferredoxin
MVSGTTPRPIAFHKVSPAAKAFTRRRGDISQQVRFASQIAFGAIALLVGIQFVLWVHYFERNATTMKVARPDGVEAWLPIAALMNLKAFMLTREVPQIHASGMFMLIAFLSISLLYRKAFCSWICPVGTISEWLWQTGRLWVRRSVTAPRWLDIPLRGLKYILLSLFLYVVITMPVPDIRAFLGSPYGMVADVKMLNFFREMGQTTAIVLTVLVLTSLVVKSAWCRYLCPYGALMGLVALVSPTRITRNADACIDCGKCGRACPAGLPVDRLASLHSAECTACMSCVAVCPAAGALDLTMGIGRKRSVVPPFALAAGIAILFCGIVGFAMWHGYWHTSLGDDVYFDLIPRASSFAHPR